MAIFIRTGANGSYKSAYTAFFVIYEALKAGRVVVTNIEGMQPLDVIEKRFYFYVTLEAKTPEGTYYLNDRFLEANDISYVHYDDCLLKLTKEAVSLNVYCKPINRDPIERKPDSANVTLGPLF